MRNELVISVQIKKELENCTIYNSLSLTYKNSSVSLFSAGAFRV